jgi:putative protease
MELLAPAGGFEQLEYALHFGADAVYLAGERFGLRQRADNFTHEKLKEAVELTHRKGKRVFVTINALMHPDDLESLAEYAGWLEDVGVDAVIMSDLGALSIVREVAPDLCIHVSTQASVTNARAALQWQELGASRVVLARELTLAEIADIRKEVGDKLELEVFVHGAMCVAYSGRCLISNYLNNRDANRGHCTQPCRWEYALVERTRPDKYIPIEEDARGTFLLSSQDLMMIEHLDELRAAGVDSLKIEGRVKGAYYVATVVNAYRQVLDGANPQDFLSEMERVSHRPYHTGFFFGAPDQTYDEVEYTQTHDLVARVLACEKETYPDECVFDGEDDGIDRITEVEISSEHEEHGFKVEDNCIENRADTFWRVTVQQRNRFWVGDELEVLSPAQPVRILAVDDLRTEWGGLTDCANRATDTYTLRSPYPLRPLDLLRRAREDTTKIL